MTDVLETMSGCHSVSPSSLIHSEHPRYVSIVARPGLEDPFDKPADQRVLTNCVAISLLMH